jgi:hypothetical protein
MVARIEATTLGLDIRDAARRRRGRWLIKKDPAEAGSFRWDMGLLQERREQLPMR